MRYPSAHPGYNIRIFFFLLFKAFLWISWRLRIVTFTGFGSGIFFIGGFPEQDLLRAVFDSTRIGGVYLRGYPPGVVFGDQYHLFNLEYRMPLFEIEKGVLSLPIYFNYIHLAAFADVGNAFFNDLKWDELKVGVGAELLLELVVGYYLPTTFRVGYARGLMDQGGNQFHFLLGYPF